MNVKDAIQYHPLLSRWVQQRYLEDFQQDGTKREASLRNTCLFILADVSNKDLSLKFLNSFVNSKGISPIQIDVVDMES